MYLETLTLLYAPQIPTVMNRYSYLKTLTLLRVSNLGDLRRPLSNRTPEHTCTRAKRPIQSINLCLRRNTVHQITCNRCKQLLFGSTTRFINNRVREHLSNDNSSVMKHIITCQRTINSESIDVQKKIHKKTTSSTCECLKHFTFENTKLDSIQNALNLKIFCFSQNYCIYRTQRSLVLIRTQNFIVY